MPLQTVAKEAGFSLEFEQGMIGGAAIDAVAHRCPRRRCGCAGRPRPSCSARWRTEMGPPPSRTEGRAGPAGSAQGARPLREPAPGALLSHAGRRLAAQALGGGGHRHHGHPELTGGLYFGEPRGVVSADGRPAASTPWSTRREIERVARVGFEVARKRRRRLASVDKANVLVVSQLWRDVVTRVAKDYPDVTLEHVLVDNCAMALVQRPTQFDTIVTENTFGDILSDEAAILAGSMGMLPSASLEARWASTSRCTGRRPTSRGAGVANPDRGDPVGRDAAAALARPTPGCRSGGSGGRRGARAGLSHADIAAAGTRAARARWGT